MGYPIMIMKYLLIISLFLFGCKATIPVSHTTSHTDSTIIRERLVPIYVPGSHVTAKFSDLQLDSLMNALGNMTMADWETNENKSQKSFYITDPKMNTRLTFALDSIGRLVLRCESIEKMY